MFAVVSSSGMRKNMKLSITASASVTGELAHHFIKFVLKLKSVYVSCIDFKNFTECQRDGVELKYFFKKTFKKNF